MKQSDRISATNGHSSNVARPSAPTSDIRELRPTVEISASEIAEMREALERLQAFFLSKIDPPKPAPVDQPLQRVREWLRSELELNTAELNTRLGWDSLTGKRSRISDLLDVLVDNGEVEVLRGRKTKDRTHAPNVARWIGDR